MALRMIPQPENVDTKLFTHQKINVHRMEQFEGTKQIPLNDETTIETNVGILGDAPGSGKTLTILALIARNKVRYNPIYQTKVQVCSNMDGSIRIVKKITIPCINTTLIVVPSSLCNQWASEIKRTKLKSVTITRQSDFHKIREESEVVICSTNMYNTFIEYLENQSPFGICFHRFVLDEMDSAYIPNMKHVNACFKWFVSATFQHTLDTINRSRKNHMMKIAFHQILSSEYKRNDVIQAITIISEPKYLAEAKIPSEYKVVHYEIPDAPLIGALHQHLGDDLVAMIEAGNIAGAVSALGGNGSNKNIAELLRDKATKAVQEAEYKVSIYDGHQKTDWERRLKEAKIKLGEIGEKIEEIKSGSCFLCTQEPMKNPILLECCQKLVCAKCIATWLRSNKTCPFCRSENPEIIYQEDEKVDMEVDPDVVIQNPVTKIDHMINICLNSEKVLLFASYEEQFGAICSSLRERKITHSTVSGTPKQRNESIQGYMVGDTRVLVLNSRENGAGLNLQKTRDVIIWNTMEPDLFLQVVGRVVRIGCDHQVTVHKLYNS